MEQTNKELMVFGIILLAIGLFASFYQVTYLVGHAPAVVLLQTVIPYQSEGIVLLVAGIIIVVLGLLYPSRRTPPPLTDLQQTSST
jgi:membrane protein implicated in regulation of membrane protease activity